MLWPPGNQIIKWAFCIYFQLQATVLQKALYHLFCFFIYTLHYYSISVHNHKKGGFMSQILSIVLEFLKTGLVPWNVHIDNIYVWIIFLPGRGDWKSSSRNFQAIRSCTLCQIWIFSISWSEDTLSGEYLVVNQSWEKSSLHGCQLKSCRQTGIWAAIQRQRKSWNQNNNIGFQLKLGALQSCKSLSRVSLISKVASLINLIWQALI